MKQSYNNKYFRLILIILSATLLQFEVFPAPASGDLIADYNVKAALIYKFMIFTHWPKPVIERSNEVVLGIVGHNPFGDIFDQATDLKIRGKKLVIRYLSTDPSRKELCQCQAIFISRTIGKDAASICKRTSTCPVLTISDIDNFIDLGGMIAFKQEHKHIRFVINIREARDVNITFNAQMLQLAIRVIDKDIIKNFPPDVSRPPFGNSHHTRMTSGHTSLLNTLAMR